MKMQKLFAVIAASGMLLLPAFGTIEPKSKFSRKFHSIAQRFN